MLQLDHVSLGLSGGRQVVREAIKKFTDNPDVSFVVVVLCCFFPRVQGSFINCLW